MLDNNCLLSEDSTGRSMLATDVIEANGDLVRNALRYGAQAEVLGSITDCRAVEACSALGPFRHVGLCMRW